MSASKLIVAAALIVALASPALAQQQKRPPAAQSAAPEVTFSIYSGPYGDRTQYLSQRGRDVSQVHEFHRLNAAGAFGRR
jgi:hypothetical protein